MTKKLFNLSKVLLLILSISFLLGSCTEEKTILPEGDFGYVLLKDNITIEKKQWTWDQDNNRYKASVSFPELYKNEYEVGMVIGNMYTFDKDDKENSTPLPYIRSYFDNEFVFTETISCALSYDKKNVEFYIEASDKMGDLDVPQTYHFKVALIYNFKY